MIFGKMLDDHWTTPPGLGESYKVSAGPANEDKRVLGLCTLCCLPFLPFIKDLVCECVDLTRVDNRAHSLGLTTMPQNQTSLQLPSRISAAN